MNANIEINSSVPISTSTFNLGFLNKFRNGVRIININPNKLLIKNRG